MATSMELSPQNVVTALQDLSVEKTTELVFFLGVPVTVTDDFEKRYDGLNRKIHSIQAWLVVYTCIVWTSLLTSGPVVHVLYGLASSPQVQWYMYCMD